VAERLHDARETTEHDHAAHRPEHRRHRLRRQGRGRGGSQRLAHPLPAHGPPKVRAAADLNHDGRFTGMVYAFCEGGR